MSILEWFWSGKGEIALAGIAGSAVSVAMEWTGFWSGMRRLVVGALTAYFMAPIGLPIFRWVLGQIDVPVEQSAGVGGFILGIGGVIIVEIILKAFRIKRAELKDRNNG
ncbi:MAG: hypothetical protein ACK4M8_05425 [Allorhizobium sp.]